MKEFKLAKLFGEKVERGQRLVKENRIAGPTPLVTAGEQNQGIAENINADGHITYEDAITIDMFGNAFYRDYTFCADDNILILKNNSFTRGIYLFITTAINQHSDKYSYAQQYRQKSYAVETVFLPVKNTVAPDYGLIENLIGGGIDMSKIDTSTWKEFKLTDIFDIEGSKTTPKTELSLSPNGKYPYITTQSINNGIAGYSDTWTELGGCLTVDSAVLGTVFYQAENFTASDHVEKLIPKFEMSEKMALWLQAILQKNAAELGYSYQKKRSQKALAEETILLPYKETEEIDFEYMENYISELEAERISELEAERISELEAYLAVTGLDNYELTEDDIEVLNRYRTEVEVVA